MTVGGNAFDIAKAIKLYILPKIRQRSQKKHIALYMWNNEDPLQGLVSFLPVMFAAHHCEIIQDESHSLLSLTTTVA